MTDTNGKLMCNVLFVPSVQPEGDAWPFCVTGVIWCCAMNQDGGTAENYRPLSCFEVKEQNNNKLLSLELYLHFV